MPPTINATPASPTANSYLTVDEADAYFESRLPLASPWEDQENKEALLIMATRTMDALFRGAKVLIQASGSTPAHYLVRRKWTGVPSTTTQRLAWPRTGMLDQNDNLIDPMSIPQDLKDAVAELAGQLGNADRTLDNDVAIQGITSVQAGSVSVSFRDGVILSQVLPDAAVNLLPPSWFTEELNEGTEPFDFEVM